MNFKIRRIMKGKKVNKLWRNYWINPRVNFKTRLVLEKEKQTIISQMPRCRLDKHVDPCP